MINNDNFIIETDKNLEYIDELILYLNNNIKNIMNFFELKKLKSKVIIVIWNDLEQYKKHIEKFYIYQDYMCADTNDGNINILSLEEAHKTKEHFSMSLDDMKSIICHEFVHICQQNCEIEKLDNDIIWFWEALATNLGNKEKFIEIPINATYEEINNFNLLDNNYLISYTIGRYLLENLSHKKILEYVKYPSHLQKDLKKIITNAIEWSKNF